MTHVGSDPEVFFIVLWVPPSIRWRSVKLTIRQSVLLRLSEDKRLPPWQGRKRSWPPAPSVVVQSSAQEMTSPAVVSKGRRAPDDDREQLRKSSLKPRLNLSWRGTKETSIARETIRLMLKETSDFSRVLLLWTFLFKDMINGSEEDYWTTNHQISPRVACWTARQRSFFLLGQLLPLASHAINKRFSNCF